MNPCHAPAYPPLPGLAGKLKFDPLSPFLAVVVPLAVVAFAQHIPILPALVAVLLVALVSVQPYRGTLAALVVIAGSSLVACGTTLAIPLERLPLEQRWLIDSPGITLGLRLAAILSMVILAGLLSSPENMLLACVIHLHLPWRIAQAGITSLGMMRVLRREHRSILEALELRGRGCTIPAARACVNWLRSAPVLLAAAVRHAERIAISMDTRGFGAYPKRSIDVPFRWRLRDTLIVIIGMVLAVTLISLSWDAGFGIGPSHYMGAAQ